MLKTVGRAQVYAFQNLSSLQCLTYGFALSASRLCQSLMARTTSLKTATSSAFSAIFLPLLELHIVLLHHSLWLISYSQKIERDPIRKRLALYQTGMLGTWTIRILQSQKIWVTCVSSVIDISVVVKHLNGTEINRSRIKRVFDMTRAIAFLVVGKHMNSTNKIRLGKRNYSVVKSAMAFL